MKDKDTELLSEAYGTITLQKLFNHPAIQEFVKNPDRELSDEAYEIAFNYYLDNGEMPYGTAKARTGDPYNWISDRLEQDFNSYTKTKPLGL